MAKSAPMLSPLKICRAFLADRNGANSIEYALIVSGVALAILTAVGFLGSQVLDTFEAINSTIADANK